MTDPTPGLDLIMAAILVATITVFTRQLLHTYWRCMT
jgi:hypothetical protein